MEEVNYVEMFAKVMYSLRWEHRLSQKEMGKLCGISSEMVSKIENGDNLPKFSKMGNIAKAFDLKLSELIAMMEEGRVLKEKKKMVRNTDYYDNWRLEQDKRMQEREEQRKNFTTSE